MDYQHAPSQALSFGSIICAHLPWLLAGAVNRIAIQRQKYTTTMQTRSRPWWDKVYDANMEHAQLCELKLEQMPIIMRGNVCFCSCCIVLFIFAVKRAKMRWK